MLFLLCKFHQNNCVYALNVIGNNINKVEKDMIKIIGLSIFIINIFSMGHFYNKILGKENYGIFDGSYKLIKYSKDIENSKEKFFIYSLVFFNLGSYIFFLLTLILF